MAKEVFYFSHDSNARNDPKILSMRCDYGMEGYAMYFMIVECLREEETYKLGLNNNTCRALAMQMHCKVDAIQKFIDDCINVYDLFASDGDEFWSNSLLKRMEKMHDIRDKRKRAAAKRWDSDANGMQMHSKSNAKGKQTDANKKEKEKESIYIRAQDLSMTKTEYEKLTDMYGKRNVDDKIEYAKNYRKLKNYKSLYRTLNNWLKKDGKEQGPKGIPKDNPRPSGRREENLLEILRAREEERKQHEQSAGS